jgi:hypothetical protein
MECDEFAVVYVRAFESGPFIALWQKIQVFYVPYTNFASMLLV